MSTGISPTEAAAAQSPLPKQSGWTLYILECSDATFYTGIAKDVGRRLLQHNDGRASRYTRGRGPVRVVYQEPCVNRSDALIKEAAIKSLPRREKENLIKLNLDLFAFRPSSARIGRRERGSGPSG